MRVFRPLSLTILLTFLLATRVPADTIPESEAIDWGSLIRQSFTFLGVQHAVRIATESDTRAGLGGPFFKGWAESVGNLHGWADGDPFFVNYIGHPMEGAVAGYIFVANDPRYRAVEFGRNRDYWRSRLRAAAWAWAYSTQFEIGPVSEATLGKVQSHFPQQGFADHVVTPAIGMAWMIAEDAVDKYLIRSIEARTDNRTVRILSRGFLNPSRSMANMMQGRLPWYRTPREFFGSSRPPREAVPERAYAPFELAMQYGYSQVGSTGCNGGGAAALFNFNTHLGFEADVGGCKVVSSVPDVSGDATYYLAGPRYTFRDLGRWTPYIHALAGGEKLTSETFYPDKKPLMTPNLSKLEGYELHSLYTTDTDATNFAVQFGGGVDYTINHALAFRVAGLEYLHSPNSRSNLRFETGLVLRMGTW